MVSPEIEQYILTSTQAGTPPSVVKSTLIQQGLNESDIDEAFVKLAVLPQNQSHSSSPNTILTSISSFVTQPSRLKIVAVIVIIILLLGAGGVAGAYFYFQSPEKMSLRTLNSLSDITSFSYRGRANMTFTFNEDPRLPSLETYQASPQFEKPFTADLEMSGQVNTENIRDIRTDSNISLSVVASIFNISMKMRVVGIGENSYVRVTELPDLGMSDSVLKNTWIKFNTFEESENTDKSNTLPEEDKEKVKDVYLKNQFFVLTEKHGSEMISPGTRAIKYTFLIDTKTLQSFLTEYQKIIGEQPTKEEIDEMQQTLAFMEKNKLNTGSIWVDSWSARPRKISMNSESLSSEFVNASFKFDIFLNDYNAPVVIDEPKESKTLEELVGSIYPQYPINSNPLTPEPSFGTYSKTPESTQSSLLQLLPFLQSPRPL